MAKWNDWKPRRGMDRKTFKMVYWVEKPFYIKGVRKMVVIRVPSWDDALTKSAKLNALAL